jgi:hypothetical protein
MQHSLKYYLTLTLFLSFYKFCPAKGPMAEKIKITGNVIEKNTKQPLEYATVTVINSKAQNCSWRYHKSKRRI